MERKVIWSSRAVNSFHSLIEFLEVKWEAKVIQNLIKEVDSTFNLTITFQHGNKIETLNGCYSCVKWLKVPVKWEDGYH